MIPNAWSGFDFGLGADVDMLRKTVSDFAQDRIAPRADAIDRDNVFPRDLWPEMGALGLHGITVEEEYGGSGLGYLEHCIAMEEVSRASAAVGLSYGAHSNLCVNQHRRNGIQGFCASSEARQAGHAWIRYQRIGVHRLRSSRGERARSCRQWRQRADVRPRL